MFSYSNGADSYTKLQAYLLYMYSNMNSLKRLFLKEKKEKKEA